jgi:hypothetical protein
MPKMRSNDVIADHRAGTTAPKGLNRKSSMRANVFRCSPNNGRRQDTSACPFRAKTGSDKPYSITSSARVRRDAGISRPSDFAVLRLMASRNLVGCSIGRSAGLAPLRIRST